MNAVNVSIKRLAHAAGLQLPSYATVGSAGLDLPAAVDESVVIQPAARTAIPTGLCLGLPTGYEAQVRPRSGLALRHGLTVLNSPGTVDSDYRGEVMVILINHGNTPFTVARGDRIAQLVVAPVSRAVWIEIAEIEDTERGTEGFGSTGTAALGTS